MLAFSIRAVTFLPCGGLKGGKVDMPDVVTGVGLGGGAWGPAEFPDADAYVSGSSAMAAAALV